MTLPLELINWDVSPYIFGEDFRIRWYGLLMVGGFVAGYYIVRKMFKAEGVKEDLLDRLTIFVLIGGILGARLGHVFFYDWDYYSQHTNEILAIWEGGLASHGGALGILITLAIFTMITKGNYLWALDRVVVPTALAGMMIRLGNLMNSEIVGSVTDVPWAFHFERFTHAVTRDPDAAGVGRHPAQLYEAIAYLLIFVLLYRMYWKGGAGKYRGYLFGMFTVLIFAMRFIIEFVKEAQAELDQTSVLNTGQLLSIPLVAIGLFFVIWSRMKGTTDKPGAGPKYLIKHAEKQ
jgi:prolipoprotein diacylglyceryl transferase